MWNNNDKNEPLNNSTYWEHVMCKLFYQGKTSSWILCKPIVLILLFFTILILWNVLFFSNSEGGFFAPNRKIDSAYTLLCYCENIFSKLYLFRNTYRLSPFLEVYVSNGNYVAVARKKIYMGREVCDTNVHFMKRVFAWWL